jgi:Na+/melibiose symporter-like transporter
VARIDPALVGTVMLLGKIWDAVSDPLFGLFAAGWILTIFGYAPDVAQSAQSLLGIRLFFGPVPSLLVILSLPLLIWFPITRKTHLETLKQLKQQL